MSDKAANAATAPGARRPETHSLKQRAADEIRRYFVLFLYLWLLFAMFSLNQRIVLRENGIGFTSQGFAFVNALVLAKVMLLFEAFDPGRWLRRRPLIYPILFEAFLLTILFFVAHVLEEVIKGLFRGEAVHEGLPSIGGGGLMGLLSVGVIMFVALVPFFAFRNLGLVLGADRLRSLVFGAPGRSPGASEP
jgi:hypothetical protein